MADNRIYKGIKNSVEERFKVREMWYYRVGERDDNTPSPSSKQRSTNRIYSSYGTLTYLKDFHQPQRSA